MTITIDKTEHPDVVALNTVYAVLGRRHDEQTVLDIVNAMFNEGVVFRMAQWWVEAQPDAKGASER